MDKFSTSDLELLLKQRGGIRISFYLPTHHSGRETQQAPTRLKNLLRQAEAELAAWIPRNTESLRLLQPVTELIADKKFWRTQSDGLAIFLSEQDMVFYRLPLSFPERVVVSDHFHVRPLLPLLSDDGAFYLVALSLKSIRLFQGSRDTLESVPLSGFSLSLEESLGYVHMELQQLYRPTASRVFAGTKAFYGHGTAVEEPRAEVREFLQQASKGLRAYLADTRRPLLLAGVESVLSVFKEVNGYANTLEPHLGGNPDDVPEQDLHRRAWAVMGPYFYRKQREAAALYNQRAGTGLASTDVAEVLRAAVEGRVERLFLAHDADRWGRYDPDTGTVTLHPDHEPGDEALLDRCAAETLLHHGEVFAVNGAELPDTAGKAPLAAIYRF